MTILDELHQDHINLEKLLNLLEDNIGQVKAGAAPNFLLASEIAEYIENYVKQYHHPREDRLFVFFRGRLSELDAVMGQCEQEHFALERKGRSLVSIVEGAMHDAVVPMHELVSRIESFVRDERAHLNLEEGKVFPTIAKVATEDDWARLERLLPRESDPLFSALQADRYAALLQELQPTQR